jgi:serine/threonine protein kinase
MIKGNVSFMSPEQARGEHVDRRSDIFSAGVVLFYCLTAEILYPGENTLNRLVRAALGPAAPQFSQIEKLPPPAAQVLGRALAPDPSKRYPNATEFQRDVKPHVGSRADLGAVMDTLFPRAERRMIR